MRAYFRVGVFAALAMLVSCFVLAAPVAAADKPFQRDDLADARSSSRRQIKTDAGAVAKPSATLRATPTRRSRSAISAPACRSSARSSRSRRTTARNWLRLARTILQIRADRRPRAHAAARARRDRRLYRLSARRQRAARRPTASSILGRTFADRKRVAPGARHAAPLARPARDRRRARPVRAAARGSRLPHARLHGRCRRGLAARLLPVLRGAAGQAHRFLALRRGRRPGQAGALGRGEAALRRGPEARRALLDHAARRPALGGARRRCRSPPTSPSTCATASRSCASPARPTCCRAPASAASRWSASTPTA